MTAFAASADVLEAIVRHCESGGTLTPTSPLVVLAEQALRADPETNGNPGSASDRALLPSYQPGKVGLSQDEIEIRRKTLGASEIAAVVGVNPWATVHSVWSSKCLGVDFEGNEATYLGNFLEAAILAIYADRYGVSLTRGAYCRGPEPWTSCTPDAHRIGGQNALVEAKLVGLRSLWMWGPGNTDERESDEIPLHYLSQVQWQMLVTGAEYVDVAALMGTEFRTYRIRRNADVQTRLLDLGRRFWFDHVVPRVPPPVDGSESARDMLRALYPKSGAEPVQADPRLEAMVADLVRARDALCVADAEKRLAENRIKEVLADARGAYGDGWRIRYATTKAGTRPFVFDPDKQGKTA